MPPPGTSTALHLTKIEGETITRGDKEPRTQKIKGREPNSRLVIISSAVNER